MQRFGFKSIYCFRHHIQSDICHEVLNEYLGEHTSLFIHELVCFAKSSFDISNYDRYVQYE
ncbi:hypothetical protein BC833DRAFT_613375 [Globomyces pollinis-pini]|nr:hypothetical protein BC833DRAFT_613375 [Globomyces pollinis-pini]